MIILRRHLAITPDYNKTGTPTMKLNSMQRKKYVCTYTLSIFDKLFHNIDKNLMKGI